MRRHLSPTQIGGVTAKDGQTDCGDQQREPRPGDPHDLRREPAQMIVLRIFLTAHWLQQQGHR